MTDAKKPPAPPVSDPVVEAKARIAQLQTLVRQIEAEVHVLEGRVKNLNAKTLSEMLKSNSALRKRVPKLQQALLALLLDRHRARDIQELEIDTEALRKPFIEFCKNAEIEPELWKSIEY